MPVGQREIRELAHECGLDGAGISPAVPVPVEPDEASRLVARAPAELDYLARRIRDRLDPRRLMPETRSVVSAFVSYHSEVPGLEGLEPGRGFVSRFAWFRDYHVTVGKRMKRLARLLRDRYGARARWYVDTGPVFEKAYAAAAGLGFVGKNTLLVTPEYGSFVFLGSILTDLECDGPAARVSDGCGRCKACVHACPTGALDEPYVLDAARCLAHLTVTDRHPPGPDLAPVLQGNLFGCDICQDACPFNRRAKKPGHPEFAPLPGVRAPLLDDVLAMDEERFRAVFGRTPVRRRGLELLKATARLLARD